MSMDKQTRTEYEARVKEMNSMYATERARFKKGEKVGVEKGANEKAVEVAKNGMSIELSAKYSGLSIKEIKRL